MNIPRHVVIVPDGNRRWAKKKGRPAFFGHSAGAKAAEEVLKASEKMGLEYVTLWGCSVNNLTERGPVEVKFLYEIFERMFKKIEKQARFFEKQGIRVRVLGRWEEFFPPGLKNVVSRVIKNTENFKGKNLTFLMAYDGRDEMLAAVHSVAGKNTSASKKISVGEKISAETLKNHLWTKDLPPVDLVIRTGGEPHWSAGLMMWDVSEARLYFTKTLWPDFGPKELGKALKEYARSERRYGK